MSSNREPPAHYLGRAPRDLSEAVTEFTSRVMEKLCSQGHHACRILMFTRAPSGREEPQYSKAIAVPLRLPTSDTAQLVRASLHGLRAIYREGFSFAKAGGGSAGAGAGCRRAEGAAAR